MSQIVALIDAFGGVRAIVRVIVAVDAEAYAYSTDPLLNAWCEIGPFCFRCIDEDARECDGVHLAFIVGVVDVFELAVVLVYKRERRYGRGNKGYEFRY
jgi:hypothetical protein